MCYCDIRLPFKAHLKCTKTPNIMRTCEGSGGNVGSCSHEMEILNHMCSIHKRSDSVANVCLGILDYVSAGYVQIKEH